MIKKTGLPHAWAGILWTVCYFFFRSPSQDELALSSLVFFPVGLKLRVLSHPTQVCPPPSALSAWTWLGLYVSCESVSSLGALFFSVVIDTTTAQLLLFWLVRAHYKLPSSFEYQCFNWIFIIHNQIKFKKMKLFFTSFCSFVVLSWCAQMRYFFLLVWLKMISSHHI